MPFTPEEIEANYALIQERLCNLSDDFHHRLAEATADDHSRLQRRIKRLVVDTPVQDLANIIRYVP